MKNLYAFLIAACFATAATATPYCTPAPSYASASCSTYGMNISRLVVSGSSGTLFDTAHCLGTGYYDRTSLSTTTLTAGAGYTATIGTSTMYNMNCQAWIDFNADTVFQSSETIGGLNTYTGAVNTFSISTPSSMASGTYRMRVIATYNGTGPTYPTMDPCMTGYAYGEGRDYMITIGGGSSGCSGTPTGGTASATTSTSCATSSLTLTNTGYTTGSGISLQWQSSPAGASTWTNISGATNATEYMMAPSASTDYQCVVTCSGSGMSASSSTASVSVDKIAGHISYSSTAPDSLLLKVWLIYHNVSAGTLTAIDSVTTCLDSLAPYYEFNGMGTGSYLVKAQSLDVTSSTVGSSGFVPTYGASSASWSSATTVTHTAGLADSLHINMIYGTVPSGPGFIGGLISSGAGKNTAADIPAVHMLVYLKNTSSGVITWAYTDVTGAYSFSGIGTGAYIIYPEELNYATTPSATINVTSSDSHITGINFKQYTGSKTIKPIVNAVPVIANNSNFRMYPNPANSQLTINWDAQSNGNASVIIADVTGRKVYNQSVDLSVTNGKSIIDLASISNGIYVVKINSGTISYTEKLTVQH